jgi:hypothetical protein
MLMKYHPLASELDLAVPTNWLRFSLAARAAITALNRIETAPVFIPGSCLSLLRCTGYFNIQELMGKIKAPARSWRCSRCSERLAEWHDRPR